MVSADARRQHQPVVTNILEFLMPMVGASMPPNILEFLMPMVRASILEFLMPMVRASMPPMAMRRLQLLCMSPGNAEASAASITQEEVACQNH